MFANAASLNAVASLDDTNLRVTETPPTRVADLARRAHFGEIEAFEELVAHFDQRILGFLRQRLGNDHDAQDVTQETFVRAWRSMARFDPARDFATWLFVIARRTASNHCRSRRPHDEISEDLPSADTPPFESADGHERAEILWACARRLKPRQFEALWLRYAEGFSVAETAKVLGLTSIHTKVILHRARNDLARKLKGKEL